MLLVASNVREFAEDDAERITRRLDNHGTFAGALLRDPRYADESNVGKFRVELDALAPTLRHLLHIITGRHEFAPIEAPSPTKRSLLARWMKR
jgi:hypothetical protein